MRKEIFFVLVIFYFFLMVIFFVMKSYVMFDVCFKFEILCYLEIIWMSGFFCILGL